MYNLLKGEILKMKSNIVLRWMFFVVIAAAIMRAKEHIEYLNICNQGEWFLEKSYGADIFVYNVCSLNNIIVISSILGITFICKDFEDKICSSMVSKGISRLKILLSKTIAYFGIIFIVLFIYALISTLPPNIIFRDRFVFNEYLVLQMFRAYLLSFLINLGIASFIIMFSYILKNTIKTLAIWGGSIFICQCIFENLCGKSPEIHEACTSYCILGLIERVGINMTLGDTILVISVSLIHTIVLFIITYMIFKRSDLRV